MSVQERIGKALARGQRRLPKAVLRRRHGDEGGPPIHEKSRGHKPKRLRPQAGTGAAQNVEEAEVPDFIETSKSFRFSL